jgi:glucosamine--fructose-6-phosphate aminotransferase (isomerizing)
VRGYTVYGIGNLDAEGNPDAGSTIIVKKKGGLAAAMTSRTETSPLLMGTKRTIVSTGHVYVGRGKSDGASIVIIPLLGENNYVRNLLLVHVDYNELLSLRQKKEVLGYRYDDIRNLVNEYNIVWDDQYLKNIPLAELMSEPAEDLAGRIRSWAVAQN